MKNYRFNDRILECDGVIHANTKRAAEIIQRYNDSSSYSLADAYTTGGSEFKRAAEDSIKELMHQCGGHDYKIIGHCSCFFTAGWRINNYLVYETANYRYLVEM